MAWPQRLLPIFAFAVFAQLSSMAQQSSEPVVLDRVVAVVNDRAILESDVKEETRLAVLEPSGAEGRPENPQAALQRLISRTLIRQQIREEDEQTALPTPDEVASRIAEIRKELPICVREDCATDPGWQAFLSRHDLTQQQVESYLRDRLATLRFIEERFRQGVRVSQDEIATYYRDTLLPQYQPGQTVPPLEQVAPRIQEILLQQHVNTLFGDWLDNLRKQGQVEVLDHSLDSPAGAKDGGADSQ
jgi:hypothetical protein